MKNNPTTLAYNTKRWKSENKERVITYQRSYSRRNHAKRLLYSSRKSAKQRGLEHTIAEYDIIIPTHCPVFGFPFSDSVMEQASIDRVNPTKGYIPGNIQIISRKANTMKLNATPDELRAFAYWVLNG